MTPTTSTTRTIAPKGLSEARVSQRERLSQNSEGSA